MANTVNLVTTFLPLVDEKFTTESRKSLLTNNDFDWTGRTPSRFIRSALRP